MWAPRGNNDSFTRKLINDPSGWASMHKWRGHDLVIDIGHFCYNWHGQLALLLSCRAINGMREGRYTRMGPYVPTSARFAFYGGRCAIKHQIHGSRFVHVDKGSPAKIWIPLLSWLFSMTSEKHWFWPGQCTSLVLDIIQITSGNTESSHIPRSGAIDFLG